MSMAATVANTYKKKIPGAQDGFDPLANLAEQQLQAQQLQNQMGMLEALMALDQYLNPAGRDPAELAGEERLRAQTLAQSYHPDATYALGLEPGGLFDAMAAAIGKIGPTPTLDMPSRMINKVPLGAVGDMGPPPQAGGQFNDVLAQVAQLLATQLAGSLGGGQQELQVQVPEIEPYQGKGPSFAYPVQYDEPIGPVGAPEQRRRDEEQLRAENFPGGGLEEAVRTILGAVLRGGQQTAESLTPNPRRIPQFFRLGGR